MGESDQVSSLLKKVSGTLGHLNLRSCFRVPQSSRHLFQQAANPYSSCGAAATGLLAKYGPSSGSWVYQDLDGSELVVVLRFDRKDASKLFRMVSRRPDGNWVSKGPAGPRPLYRRPDLLRSKTVFVCQGECAADAIHHLGLVATTAMPGANSLLDTDWSPLAGQTIVLLPDEGNAGRRYVTTVTRLLRKLDRSARILTIKLPGLPLEGGVVDWVADFGEATEPVAIRSELCKLVDQAERDAATDSSLLKKVSGTLRHPGFLEVSGCLQSSRHLFQQAATTSGDVKPDCSPIGAGANDPLDRLCTKKVSGTLETVRAEGLGYDRKVPDTFFVQSPLDPSPLDGHDVETSSADRPFEPNRTLPPPFEPFPVEVLPKPVRAFVCNAAEALSVDHSFVALPVLAMLGAASGNTRLQIKEGWIEPPILWTAIVGNSGSGKTPALELALQAVKDLELSLQSRYEMTLRKWASGETPRPKPDYVKLIADDATIEGLAEALSNEQRGVVVACDELAEWLSSCTSRKNVKARGAQWRELFRGGSIKLPRKGRDSKPLHLNYGTVCLTGGIQPETLKRFITRTQVDSGLAARLLFACPPARVRQWSDAEVDPQIYRAFVEFFEGLSVRKRPSPKKGGNDPGPQIVTFSPAAKDRFKQFVNEHAAVEFQTDDDLSSAWSKLLCTKKVSGTFPWDPDPYAYTACRVPDTFFVQSRSKLQSYAARLALVIHRAKVTTGAGVESTIDVESIDAGITLSRWFGREARRIHTIGDESPHEANHRKLVELIERQGGTMTARDLVRNSRRFANSRDAESALDNLVKLGVGAWETVSGLQTGGKPCRRFVLSQPAEIGSLSTLPPKT